MKIIIVIIGLLLVFQMPLSVYAKNDKSNGSNRPTTSGSQTGQDKSSAGKLNRIIEETDDPEVEQEVEEIAEEQEQVEEEAQQAILENSDRPSAIKFLIGPDYRNLGQLRSAVVQIRNNIRKMEQVQERAGEEEQPEIAAAIMEMEETALRLQAEIYGKLGDFSLFGWLFRWLSGFTPPEEEVTPSVTPTIDPELTVTLTPTPEVTEEVSPTPTLLPTP